MNSGKTWRVPSLDDEAQDAATEAARQAGLSVNEWMDQAFAQRTTREAQARMAEPAPSGDDIGAVTDAVDQLNRRIRAMDPRSRSAVAGLKSRLDEIENTLSRAAEQAERGDYGSQALQGVAAMVDRLTRDIDNTDETARSTVEGLRARPGDAPRYDAAAPPARDPGDQIGVAIRALDERIADMADRLKRPPAAERSQKLDDLRLRLEGLLARNTATAWPASAERTPPIDSTLKALERRIEEATSRMASPPPPPTPIEVTAVISPEQEERMRRIEEHLFHISDRMSEPSPTLPPVAVLSAEEQDRARRIESHLAEIAGRLSEPQAPVPVMLSFEDEDRMRQIEARLNDITQRLAEPPPPSPTLTQVDNLSAAIVEIAHRQKSLDDRADGQAMRREQKAIADAVATLRSDVSGLVARVTAIGRLELEGRDAYAGLAHRLENLAAESPVDRGILSGIRTEIDALRAISAGSAREDTVSERLEELARMVPDRGRIDALGEEISALRRALETADSPRAIARVEARVAELARNVDTAINSRVAAADATSANLTAGLTEVRRNLENLVAESRRVKHDPGIASLNAGLAEVRAAMDAQRGGADQAQAAIAGLSGSITDIRAAIDRLAAAGRQSDPTGTLTLGLRQGFADLRTAVEGMTQASGRNTSQAVVSGLSESLAGVRAAIDDLTAASRQADPAAAVISGLAGSLIDIRTAIDELASTSRTPREPAADVVAGLAEIRRSLDELAAAPRSDGGANGVAIAGLASTLTAIRGAVEDLVVTNQYSGPAHASAAISGIATSLDEIRAAIDARDADARRVDDFTLERLEARMGEMAARIDGILDFAAPADVVNGLHDRLEVLVNRLDRNHASAAHPVVLDEIKGEIAAIRREIAGREPVRVDHLEDQIRSLAGRIEDVSRPDATAEQIADLEAQVARLSTDLESAMSRPAGLREVEANLTRLQSHMSQSQQATMEAARAAALDAVRELSSGKQVDGDLLRALRGDLDRIRAASGDADHRTQETLNNLHGTLGAIVERLSRIEAAETEAEAAGQPAAPRLLAVRRTSEASLAAAASAAVTEMPAADGRAEANAGASLRDRNAGSRRGDFIAAARRAAQAAVAEASTTSPRADAGPVENRQSAFARIGQAIRSRKKPLLLAAAAVVLAIGALQLFGSPFRDRNSSLAVARIETPVAAVAAPISPPVREIADALPTAPAPKVAEPAMVAPTPDATVTLAGPGAVASRFGDNFAAPPADAMTSAPAVAPPTAAADDDADASPADVAGATATPADGQNADTGPAGPADAVSATASNPVDPTAPITVSADASDTPAVTAGTDSVEPAQSAVIGSDKLRAAAAKGDPAAAFEVATRYAEGRGVTQNLGTAAEWYKRAAVGGVAVAQYRLGSLYERGQGLKKDLTQAVNWYQRAADQGNVGAMHNLAVLMSEGVDGPPDAGKALEWFLAAGNYGVKDSQYNLGVIYARGIGHDRDMVESYKWFAIAAAQGDPDASARRDEVGGMLAADQLAKAKAEVADWHAKSPLPEANGVSVPDGGWDADSAGITEADRTALVKKIQSLLADKGFDPGPADGHEGPKTRDAVRAFQHNIGVAETGTIDKTLVVALGDKD